MSARILVVEGSEPQGMRSMLDESPLDVEVTEAAGGADAVTQALSGEFDVVLANVAAPDLDGLSILRALREDHNAGDPPVILMAAEPSKDERETSFEVGAADYIAGPFTASELVARVEVQLRLRSLEKELKRAAERFRRLSTEDDLTGLANRRRFLDACHRELARARRHDLELSVCVVDIDRLRRVNARSGHRAGDALITNVANVIQRQLRSPDLLAHFSAGTFGMLLPHTNTEQASSAANRIRAAVRAHAFLGRDEGEITVSAGIATYPSGTLESIEEVVNAAQASLDRAKALGGNRVEVYDLSAAR